jgi:hypothetical protein
MFSVVAYLPNEKPQVNLSHDVVRAEAIRYLSADNVLLLDGKPFEYEQHIVTIKQAKQDHLNKMSRLGTFGDHIMLVAISCVYKVQFLVVSTLGEKAARLISATVDSCHVDTLPTLILGHFAEGEGTHYIGLLPENTAVLMNVIEKYASTSSASISAHSCNSYTSPSHSASCAASQEQLNPNLPPGDLGQKSAVPKQPHLLAFPKTKFGKQNRSFSATYYSTFPWLEYSVERDAVFCFACRHFYTDRRFVEEHFISRGVKDWKKLS